MESYPIPKFLRDSMRETAEKQAACKHENRECTYESDDGEFERWQCKDCGARWGGGGDCSVTPNVEFSGGAPLHGAASAGTKGYASGDKNE